MFNSGMQESAQSELQITDFSADVMKEFLHFMYTAECENLKENAVELLAVADKVSERNCQYHTSTSSRHIFSLLRCSEF